MDAISYTRARNELAKTIDKVNEDHAPILITRQSGSPAVLISLEDYQALEETAYLMRSPENAKRLTRAVAQIESGKAKERKLIR